jgi:hypothetical protein
MPKQLDDQITLLIRDEKTGRRAFNALALKALRRRSSSSANWAIHSKIQKNLNRIWPPNSTLAVDHCARLGCAVINGNLQGREVSFDFLRSGPRRFGRLE